MGKLKQILVAAGVLVAVVVVMLGLLSFFVPSRSAAPSANVDTSGFAAALVVPPAQRVVVEITAVDLARGYEANEVRMDDMIAGRPVRVVGQVQAIEKDFMGDAVIAMRTTNPYLAARLTLDRADRGAAASMTRGQRVKIVCERMQFLVAMPSGSACRIEPT